MRRSAFLIIGLAALMPGRAVAQEAFVGIYRHGVDTPFTLPTGESGSDVEIGYRFKPAAVLGPLGNPTSYVVASLNSGGDTSFLGGGLSWKLHAGPVFVRPGLGLVLHNAPARRVDPAARVRTDLGSRVLFEPELGIGTQLTSRLSIETSWTHISNARVLGSQNPGIDMWGVRLSFAAI